MDGEQVPNKVFMLLSIQFNYNFFLSRERAFIDIPGFISLDRCTFPVIIMSAGWKQ